MGSVAGSLRETVDKAPAGTFIRPADIPGPRAGVHIALSRLCAEGDLVRVRNGLYWKGVKSHYGSGRPGLVDAAMAAAGNVGVGPSGWAASQALGLSTQLPAEPELAVAGPIPSFVGVTFHKRNNLSRRGLNAMEVALLEVLRSYPTYCEVGPTELRERVRALATEGKLNLDNVARAAVHERSPALRRNLNLVLARDEAQWMAPSNGS